MLDIRILCTDLMLYCDILCPNKKTFNKKTCVSSNANIFWCWLGEHGSLTPAGNYGNVYTSVSTLWC